MYGITADQLDAAIIDDLQEYCAHNGMSKQMYDRIFKDNDGYKGRPICQTIRLVIEAFRYSQEQEPAKKPSRRIQK